MCGILFNITKEHIYSFRKLIAMNNLLYVIAVILIIGWGIGFFVYSAGAIIHVLLALAVIAILIRILGGTTSHP